MQGPSYSETLKALQNSETSCEQLVSSFLDRIDAQNAEINAVLAVYAESAMETAKKLDVERESGIYRKLTGMVVGIKDVICQEGRRVSCGSKMLEHFTSLYSATAVERLTREGAIVIGSTNCDEFAMGSTNELSYFGPVANPHDSTRVSGGSSGGSAAAVAAGFCHSALGSDTGGSVRQPASFCGVVGLKPTYGRVSRNGLVAYASSFDCIGTFSHSVDDGFRLLDVIAGVDERDATTLEGAPLIDVDSGSDSLEGIRVGIPAEYVAEGLSDSARSMIENAGRTLSDNGAVVSAVSLPMTEYGIAAYYVLVTAEASSNLARYDGIRYGRRAAADSLKEVYENSRTEAFGPAVKRRIMLGTYVLSAGYYKAHYDKAQRVRRLIQNDFDRVFNDVDVLLTPTTCDGAFKLGAKLDNPLEMYLTDVYTVPANLAGIPAVSIPFGKSDSGLPIGVQLLAPSFEERRLHRVGRFLESGRENERRRDL